MKELNDNEMMLVDGGVISSDTLYATGVGVGVAVVGILAAGAIIGLTGGTGAVLIGLLGASGDGLAIWAAW